MTVVCLGSGPSLRQDDVDACRGRALVIAINNSYYKAPWADILYACDAKWWRWAHGAKSFKGQKRGLDPKIHPVFSDVRLYQNTGITGLEMDPDGLKTGGSSGYQAINIAVHEGADRILLLGYDMQPGPRGDHHFHDPHPGNSHPGYKIVLPRFQTLVKPLADLGIAIVNCTRSTALTCFPHVALEEALR